jgi:TonB-linked SusC/RagA family outer membrane protein
MLIFTNGVPSIREVLIDYKTLVRAMKMTSIILLIACLQVSARTVAQRISIDVKNGSLEKIFAEIEAKSNYVFTYDALLLKGTKPVTITMKDVSVEEVLKASFKDQVLDFSILNNTIFIKRKAEKGKTENVTAFDNADGRNLPEIDGSVTDENGEPLAGATIKLNNGKIIGITDAKGQFKVKDISSDATLVFTYTGYSEKSVLVENKTSFKVSMSIATNKLDEAQVIAYGTTTERLSTGDVTKVTSKEIEQQPVGNVLAALEGRVPGLVITQTSGLPGGSFTAQIRGQSSINSGTDPFFVIDGVPYNSEMPTSNGFGLVNGSLGVGNPLNFINPYDIESVEVLKDADATAIYGSRAANGAILITTKRGKAGKMKVDLNLNSGVSSPARDIQLMNTQQYLAMRHGAFANDGATPDPNYDVDLTFWDTTRYTNWSKLLLNSHPVYTDAEASVSGGTVATQYLVGAGYNRQTSGLPTLLPGDGADEKGSVHFNLNTQSVDKRFKLSFTGSYVADRNTIQSTDFGAYRFELPPDAPALYNPDGSLNWAPKMPGQVGTYSNPYANLLVKYKGTTSNLVGNASLGYALLPGLEIKIDLGYTNTQTNELQTIPTTSYDPGLNITSGQANYNTLNSHSWIVEPQLNYKFLLGRGILTALGGATFHENDQSGQLLSGQGYISDALLDNIQAATTIGSASSSSQYKYNAFFGRLNYNWSDRYIVNLSARRDGSSRFGPGRQFGNFGSVGAAWIFSKENIIQRLMPGLSFGKIRASYGTAGNDQIGDYQYIPLYTVNTSSGYPYQNSQGLYPLSLSNPNLAWELDKKLEGGIELGFLKDRILVQGNYYRNRSGNQLVSYLVSQVTGFGSIPDNLPALVQNSGEELVFRTINIKSKTFTWSSSINISIPRNKLLSFPGLATSSYSTRYKIGQPINSFTRYHLIGVNDTTGIYQFADFKGNPTYSPNPATDLISRINTAPKFFGGFQNSFTYKGVSLDILFQFVKQTGRNIFGLINAPPGNFGNIPAAFLNAWSKPGDKKPYEQFTQKYRTVYSGFHRAQNSDFAYSDASFIRLKNLALSWQLPERWKSRAHLQNARIYLQGQNLLTFTHYLGIDPESQGLGSAPKRVWVAGFQVTL